MTLLQRILTFHRTILLLLVFFIIAGFYAYVHVPKESSPDVQIPFIIVSATHRGISPEDAEVLLVKPLEQELRSIEGLKNFFARSYDGGGTVILEFHPGFDPKQALTDVRSRVDIAKAKFPTKTDEPNVREINLSRRPVLMISLAGGSVPMRFLYKIADDLKQKIETLPGVLEVSTDGKPKEIVEVLIRPEILQRYGLITPAALADLASSNTIISAGDVITTSASSPLKTRGAFTAVDDVRKLPLVVDKLGGVTVADIADVRHTFEDPTTLSRTWGEPSVTLGVSKRTGENILQTVANVMKIVDKERKNWPASVVVSFAADDSQRILDMIKDLQNEITTAVLLVMLVIVCSLGLRPSLLVSVAIPGSFLVGIFFLYLQGYTLNIVVLFSLILSVGMLVDGAIIVVEHADRLMLEGMSPQEAFPEAAQRMLWPVVTSISTIIVAFLPLLFWPGIVGQFMRFMPITLMATLTASLLMALIFIPTLGRYIATILPDPKHGQRGGTPMGDKDRGVRLRSSQYGKNHSFGRLTLWYGKLLAAAIALPGRVLMGALGLLVTVVICFHFFGKGVEFFPDIEPESGYISIKAQGNLSLAAMDKLVRQVEEKVLVNPHLSVVKTVVGSTGHGKDEVGSVYVEFADWQTRPRSTKVMEDLMGTLDDLEGMVVEYQANKRGPRARNPIEVEFSGGSMSAINAAMDDVRRFLSAREGIIQVDDNRSPPGLEWRLTIDKFKAAQYQVPWTQIGDTLKVLTNGVFIAEFRPDKSVEPVDIILRYPQNYRHLGNLGALYVPTVQGLIPLSNFVTKSPGPRVSILRRSQGERAYKMWADVTPGTLAQPHISSLRDYIQQTNHGDVTLTLRGEQENQQETMAFLGRAFGVALFLITLILVTQFNSFYSTALVLSSVVMSTTGVLLGLMIRGMPFGTVMGGIGVIALAGIIVSNNIILIDTFDHLRKEGFSTRDAIIRSGMLRLRPVILTKLTTFLGLLPVASRVSLDYTSFSVTFGAPSSEWWVMLATAIISGVLFASPLTLIVTPCALMVRENMARLWARYTRNTKSQI